MNVLSLFDGISCGQIALNRLGISYDKYYASEIDTYAIKVTQKNYPKTIQLGDITKVFARDLDKIDLLIGGSPCQGFSYAGKGLNFNDPRSKLFFEYVRLLKETNPKYFLLENVKMKKEWQDIISKEIGVEPILINSNLVSAQNRTRLYWTNLDNYIYPEDKGTLIKDILETSVSPKYNLTVKGKLLIEKYIGNYKIKGKSPAITTKVGIVGARNTPGLIKEIGLDRKPTPIECERLQTIPDNYTEGVSDSQRYKMIGNGWTVDIIASILEQLIK